MIEITRIVKEEINEEEIFESVKDFIWDEEINEKGDLLYELPENAQRLIFAKVGAMLIDYAGKEKW
jgi:hypothetical protein